MQLCADSGNDMHHRSKVISRMDTAWVAANWLPFKQIWNKPQIHTFPVS